MSSFKDPIGHRNFKTSLRLLGFILLPLLGYQGAGAWVQRDTLIRNEKLKDQVREALAIDRSGGQMKGHRVLLKGSWTGSGGNGVACFKSAALAESATDELGRIKPDYRAKIDRLFALDVWEHQVDYSFFPPAKDEDSMRYLKRIIDLQLSRANPYLGDRIKQSLAIINQEDWTTHWNDRGALPLLVDQGELRREIPKECRLVQLAIRYTKSKPGHFPDWFIDADRDLIERMEHGPSWQDSVLFGAAFKLHEAIWLTGVELGLTDSRSSRELTAALLSSTVAARILAVPPYEQSKEWITILYGFGFKDYFSLFLREDAAKEKNKKGKKISPNERPSKSSRRAARAELHKVYEETLQYFNIDDTNGFASTNEEAKFLGELGRRLSPEQSFIFSAKSLQNAGTLNFDIDVFFIDGIDDSQQHLVVCSMIRDFLDAVKQGNNDPSVTPFRGVMSNALEYCKRTIPQIQK